MVCFDSNILIYFIENDALFGLYATDLIADAIENGGAIFSVVALTELQTKRQNPPQVEKLRLFRQSVRFLPVTETIAVAAGLLRQAHPSLRTADSLHLATAVVHKTDFQTNDKKLAKIAKACI